MTSGAKTYPFSVVRLNRSLGAFLLPFVVMGTALNNLMVDSIRYHYYMARSRVTKNKRNSLCHIPTYMRRVFKLLFLSSHAS